MTCLSISHNNLMRTSLKLRNLIQNQHSVPYCANTNHELMHFTSVEELYYTTVTVNAGNNRISKCKNVVTPKVTHNPAHLTWQRRRTSLPAPTVLILTVWISLCFAHRIFSLLSMLATGTSRPIFIIIFPKSYPITIL